MKRFVIATASALFLLAGTAAASVPYGPAGRSAHVNPFSASANGGPGVETVAPVGLAPLVPGIDPAVLADPDLAIPGLPGGVTQLFGAVDPALATLAGVVPPAVANLVPPVVAAPAPQPPAPVPGLTPAPPPQAQPKAPTPARKAASTNRLSKRAALQAAATADLFKGLPANGYAAYGSASVIHTDLLQVGNQRLENLDGAFSGATFTSAPIPDVKNEMARIVAPALAAGNAFGRGSGLEVGLAVDESGQNQVIPGSVAEAKAPPSTQLVTTEVGPVNAPPLLGASLLRGQAQSKANAACTTGTDLSYGLGYAGDLGLINSTVKSTATAPDRAVQQSRSHTFLVPREGTSTPIRKFGLASETRQTIAPITLFAGTPQEFTIETAGEWVLRATADGNKGSVFYGPGNVTPQTRVLHIFGPGVSSPLDVTSQQLLGAGGLNLTIPNVAEIVIGEKPRAINGATGSTPAETATAANGAVDVVQIKILSGAPAQVADIRIGHMEVATAVPAGGIECGIGLVKKTDKEIVGPGETFNWTVTVTNPNDCVLTKLKVVDTITASTGVIWTVDSSNPVADQKSNSGLTWNDIGPLNPGQSKDLLIRVTVSPKSGGGKFLDEALATGVCGPAAGTAGADAAVGVPLEAKVSLNLPEVNVALAAALLPRELPRTGGMLAVLPALALTGGGLLLRQSKRRKRQTP